MIEYDFTPSNSALALVGAAALKHGLNSAQA
jgi:hypothetical protein